MKPLVAKKEPTHEDLILIKQFKDEIASIQDERKLKKVRKSERITEID